MSGRQRIAWALAVLAAALACGGCGLVRVTGSDHVSVTVTRGFGSRQLGTATASRLTGSETVMRLLQRSFRVGTRNRGVSVRSINGLSGSNGRTNWFYYVNGVQATQGAGSSSVHAGDQIWWDLHDWSATDSIPAVVGSYPEPFVNGVAGKRLPTTVECATDVGAACQHVSTALAAVKIPVARQLIGTGSGPDTLGIVVGTWSEVRPELAAELIAHGPGASGVYARFTGTDGGTLALEDPQGKVVRTLGAGAGLIAATADSSSAPTWLITGTDVAGVTAASRALTSQALHDHFALAVQGARRLPVPVTGAYP